MNATRRSERPEGRNPRPAGTNPATPNRKQYFRRRKVCRFCEEKIDVIDYKETKVIGQLVSERGKILPRRLTGTCSPHQRLLAVAVKRARNIALLPFATRM